MKEGFEFNPNEYRNKLAEEIKSEPKKKRVKFLKQEKEENIWRSDEGIMKSYADAEHYHKRVLEKFHSKEAKDLTEANLIVSREYAQNFEQEVENEFCLARLFEDYGGLGKQPSQVGIALNGLPFNEALEYTERVLGKIKKNLQECCGGSNAGLRERIATAFFSIKVKTPKDLEQFVNSSLHEYVSKSTLLQKAATEEWGGEVIKALLTKVSPLSLSNVELFGEKGLLKSFEKEEKEKILQEVINLAEHQVEQREGKIAIENKNRSEGSSYSSNPYNYTFLRMEEAHIADRLAHLAGALREKMILVDYENRLQKISQTISSLKRHPSSSYVSVRSQIDEWEDKVVELGLAMEKFTEHTSSIKGEGLEITSTKFGEQQVAYLNGELIGFLKQASFSEQPTNGEVVSWVRHEILDQDRITGTQDKFTVYGWKIGLEKPKEIFEQHEWSIGGPFIISAPIVKENGEILITITLNEKIEEKKLKI